MDLFHNYKAKCKAFIDIVVADDKSIQEKNKELSEAKETICSVKDQLTVANKKCDEVQQENNAKAATIQSMQSTYNNLKLELEYSKKETDMQKERLSLIESMLKEQINSLNKELNTTKDKLDTANNEIMRLRNIKWYQKLFGKE